MEITTEEWTAHVEKLWAEGERKRNRIRNKNARDNGTYFEEPGKARARWRRYYYRHREEINRKRRKKISV